MPKALFLFIAILLVLAEPLSGQMLNSLQSPQYARMLSRSASRDIDGIIFNPAGLTSLEEGWHFMMSGQAAPFEKIAETEYPGLNKSRFASRTTTLPIPSLFGVFRRDRWAISMSAGQNLGEGSSDFSSGIPSFEIYTSTLLNHIDLGVENYTVSQSLKIKPQNNTLQAGATFAMSDIFSVYGGIRLSFLKYDIGGHFTNARVKVNGQFIPASAYLQSVGNIYKDKALALAEHTTDLKELVDAGASFYSLDMMQSVGVLTETQKNSFIAELISLGKTSASGSWTVSQTYNELDKAQKSSYAKGTELVNSGLSYQDQQIDVRKSGFGLSPIIGLNLQPSESVNLAMLFEYKAVLSDNTNAVSDFRNIFAGNELINREIPGILSAGVGMRLNPYTELQFSYRLFFTKEVAWGYNFRDKLIKDNFIKRDVENNDYELALGLQFQVTDNLFLSVGGLTSRPGTSANYHSDFSFANPSYVVAGGLNVRISERVAVDAGIMSSFFSDTRVMFTDTDLSGGEYAETYGRSSMGMGIGLTWSLLKHYRRRF